MTEKQPKRKPREGMDEYGRNGLHYAALAGDVSAVAKELTDGAAVDEQDDNGLTALHFAAQARACDVVKYLLSKGANPNLHDLHGNSPLWTAVMNARGEFACIQALLESNADGDHKNKHGRSPRDIALTIKAGLETLFG